jgi:hypothetical protein
MQNESVRIPCINCGAGVLIITAQSYDGLCKPCFDKIVNSCTNCGVKLTPRTAGSHAGLCKSCSALFSGFESAIEQTHNQQSRIEQTKNILHAALESKNESDIWQQIIAGQLAAIPPSPTLFEVPVKPEFIEPASETYIDFAPEPQPETLPAARFEKAYARWAENVKRIEAENQRRYERNLAAINDWNKQSTKREQDMAA